MKLSSIAPPPLLLLLLTALSCCHAHEGVLSVHGSGTTNPSKCYWKIMQQIMDRTKGAVRMTYRAVGSSTGQAEFIGADNDYAPYNDFGSGDIPISTDDYDALTTAGVEFVHLPVVLGAISLFHSVPGVSREDGRGLNLTACVIARIFKRDITTWDDPDVLTLNSGLVLPSEGYPINVAHRVHGSSSTASVTQYLRQTCPEEWPEDMVGKTIEWPEDTQGCEGSGGMTTCIRDTEGTIGYIDAGHGHAEDLQEIELQNADGNYLSSKEAKAKGGIGAAAGAVPTSADQDFGGVNLLNRPGPDTWPIVAMSYVYVRKDLTFIHQAQEQSLLKAFLRALYEPTFINQCADQFAFTPVPDDVRQIGLDGIDMLQTFSNATDWTFEESTEAGAGQGDFVISTKRQTYGELERSGLADDVKTLQSRVADLKKALNDMSEDMSAIRQQTETTENGQPYQTTSSSSYAAYTTDDQNQLTAALTMSSLSMVLWGLTIGFVGVKYCLGV